MNKPLQQTYGRKKDGFGAIQIEPPIFRYDTIAFTQHIYIWPDYDNIDFYGHKVYGVTELGNDFDEWKHEPKQKKWEYKAVQPDFM